ncbi:hypothetical protein [Xenorhabdus anantnagensis]|uniref:Uncharacterized protein n=1 Tax=Xenorhabdus anantnagensis TaxID=3025875 RepID=A0ABT5LQV3_9GAMM|nr:hypothetical protein [Xenorhabdus anantnagensis]MDC9596178.1 hypothetical protein [Xenorhabdus anantnagensis]
MLSKTKVAKALRKWLLDLAEKEHQPQDLALIDMESLKELTIGEMQNRLVTAKQGHCVQMAGGTSRLYRDQYVHARFRLRR